MVFCLEGIKPDSFIQELQRRCMYIGWVHRLALHDNILYVPSLTISVTSEPAKEVVVIILRKVYVRQGGLQLSYIEISIYTSHLLVLMLQHDFLRTCVPYLELPAVMKLNDSSSLSAL